MRYKRRVRTIYQAVVAVSGCLSPAGSLTLALVYCIEALFTFAHFSSVGLKRCYYFLGTFGLV